MIIIQPCCKAHYLSQDSPPGPELNSQGWAMLQQQHIISGVMQQNCLFFISIICQEAGFYFTVNYSFEDDGEAVAFLSPLTLQPSTSPTLNYSSWALCPISVPLLKFAFPWSWAAAGPAKLPMLFYLLFCSLEPESIKTQDFCSRLKVSDWNPEEDVRGFVCPVFYIK